MLISVSLLIIGFLLLAAEAFIIPGFGITGAGGILLVAGGCFLAWATQGWAAGLAVVSVSLAVTLVGLWALARSRTAKRMVLADFNPGQSAEMAPLHALVGRRGVTTSDLHPSGTAEIDGERYQVTSGGDWVETGTPVRVTRVGTFSVFVEVATDERTEGPTDRPAA